MSFNSSILQTTNRSHFRRHGIVAPLVVFGIVALILLGFAGFYWLRTGDTTSTIEPILANVSRGEFVSQVLDQGEVQSSENVEIRCEVRARNGQMTVLKVIPEGSLVKDGDFLVQLDSTSFEQELQQQKIAMANAETAVIQAETTLATAKATKNEYITFIYYLPPYQVLFPPSPLLMYHTGVFVQEQREIQNEIYKAEGEITTAKQELKQADDVLDHSRKLQAKAFITMQELESNEFSVEGKKIKLKMGENALLLAQKKMEVLEIITYAKEIVQLESDIKAAMVQLASEKDAYEVEKEKLAEIETMIEKCTINVPDGVSGQVVFAKESSRGGNDWVLEEGTTVRENQVLIRLPNPEKMQVKALINEQSITQIEPNMPASIKVDALNNTTLKGVVTKVNQYAESSGWMSSSVRKYAVFVRIISPPPALKPGMNSSVAIQVRFEPDALLAPIQTIYGVQEQRFCLAKKGDQWETLEVEVGGDNAEMVYFKDGVEEGMELVMNPGAFKEYMDLPEMKLDTRIEIPDGELTTIGQTSTEAGSFDGPSAELGKRPGGGKAGGPRKNGNPPGGGKAGGPGGGRQAGGPGGGQPGGRQAGGGPGGGQPGGRQAGGPGGGMGGFSMPASGAALIQSKDTDGDGKLTKDEAGSPYTFFFDQIDTDGDGFLSQTEADASVQQMTQRMQSMQGGGGGGFGGGGQ